MSKTKWAVIAYGIPFLALFALMMAGAKWIYDTSGTFLAIGFVVAVFATTGLSVLVMYAGAKMQEDNE